MKARLACFVLAALALPPARVDACSVCFGGVESPLLDAARVGVLVMAAVTCGVLAAFASWFVRLRKLQRAAVDRRTPDPAPRTPA